MINAILIYAITSLGCCILYLSCWSEENYDLKQLIKQCSEDFNARVICETRYVDRVGSYAVAIVMHIMFIWLAIFYWGYVWFHLNRKD